MRHFAILPAALATLAGCGGAEPPDTATAPPVDDRPNIVFVLYDNLRWDELGIAGHP